MMATVLDKKVILRDKRAQGIAAMGLVTREGDRFRVQTPSLRGRRTNYEVWRDDGGRVRCTCLEYEEHSASDGGYRCEHILAVKHSLVTKNSEAVTKQQSLQSGETEEIASASATVETKRANAMSLKVNARASEKRADDNGLPVTPVAANETARFGRERNEAKEAVSAAIDTVSLAQETEIEEKEMKNTQAEIENIAVPAHHEPLHVVESSTEEHRASVVPLAFTNTLRTLRQPVEPKLVKTREGWIDRQGNTHLVEYVEWHTVADILDRVCPTWSHSVRHITQIGDMVAVTAAITIDGVTREGVGTGTADNETGIKKAEHDALKRAAIKFGLARDLYQRETEVIEKEGRAPAANEFPRDPLAKTMADLVTPKQLGMIRALAREANVDVEAECQAVLRCRTEELSKRAASSFIDHLKNMQQEAGDAAATVRRAS